VSVLFCHATAIPARLPLTTTCPAMSATPSKRPRAASHEAVLDSPLKNGQRPASPSAQAPPAATSKAAAAAPPPPSAAEPPSAASFDSSSSRTHAERSIGASSGAPAVERREEPKSEDEEEEVEEEQPYDDTADQATRTDMYLDTVREPLLACFLKVYPPVS
jgi:hypothetical protein